MVNPVLAPLTRMGANTGFTTNGYASWARLLSGTRTRTDLSHIFATSGFTSAQVRATHIPGVIAAPVFYAYIKRELIYLRLV